MGRPKTLADRLAASTARKAVAVTTFENAARALDVAAAEHADIAAEALAESDRLKDLAHDAQAQADHATRVAENVRALTA